MVQLTVIEEKKQRIIYKCCIAALAFGGFSFVALGLVGAFFPQNQILLKGVVCLLLSSSIPVFIAGYMLPRLKIRRHVETGDYSLPYKLRKEKSVFFLFGGIALLISVMMIPSILRGEPFAITKNISLPGWTAIPIFAWGPFGLFPIIAVLAWGVVLSNDHLCQYLWWKKCKIFYSDIKGIEVKRRSTGQGSQYYVIVIHHMGAGKSPLEFSLATTPAKDCAIMLDVIQKNSPDVILNDMAQEMRHGKFPMG